MQHLDFLGRAGSSVEEEEYLLQAAWNERCGRKTAIAWQDLTEDGVLKENTGSLATSKLRDAYKEQLEETAGFADDGLWVRYSDRMLRGGKRQIEGRDRKEDL